MQPTKKKVSLNDVLNSFCQTAKIPNWKQFKLSKQVVAFYSKALNKQCYVYGNALKNPNPTHYSATELEEIFSNGINKKQLQVIHEIKQLFGGQIIKKED